MKTHFLNTTIILSSLFAISCASSNTDTVKSNQESKTEQIEAATKAAVAKETPEAKQTKYDAATRLNNAIEEYGRPEYLALQPQYNKILKEFSSNPSIETKNALVNFHRDNKLFARLDKPISKEQIAEAQANGTTVFVDFTIEKDINVIDKYYADKIERFAERKSQQK